MLCIFRRRCLEFAFLYHERAQSKLFSLLLLFFFFSPLILFLLLNPSSSSSFNIMKIPLNNGSIHFLPANGHGSRSLSLSTLEASLKRRSRQGGLGSIPWSGRAVTSYVWPVWGKKSLPKALASEARTSEDDNNYYVTNIYLLKFICWGSLFTLTDIL